ncbi:MAG TPA: BTAD domain-containing putative transcriptional regulator [Steroidobacteraceae bacterium]|nr:BTAD domain-containing putative transcriptional regulator [Steroidobacteraceae bacterium]
MAAAALAKLSRPKLYSAIPRARLFQRLDQAREHAAIWVCGPPGAGKTTLVASYVSERDIPSIWYQVDAGDGDPATFFYYLGMAADQAAKGKHKPLPLLTPEFRHDLDGFSRRYFRELFSQLPERALLVLDNAQEAPADSSFQSILESFVDEIPEAVNVLCISRADPPTTFARYASTGRLATLEWAELRLTLDETRQIAAVKQPIEERTLLRLFEQSEGWAAGLTLMLERIARTGDVPEAIEAETREAVFNYFAGTLFDKQPADTRQVLLRTAFLPQITPSLAESLTGNPNAGKALEHLHRRHLFTYRRRLGLTRAPTKKRESDADEATYEYHALFRDFLLTKAQEEYSRAGLRRLLEETAQLLETIERDEEALALYRDAEDWEAVARLLLKQAPRLLRQGRAQTLRDWIAGVPDAEVGGRPWISYWLGVSLIPIDQLEAIGCLERAFEQFKGIADRTGQIACAARVIEAIYRGYVNTKLVEGWIEELDTLLADDVEISDPDLQLQAYCSLMLATTSCSPRHPRLRSSVERVSRLLAQGLVPDQMVTAGDVLLRYFAWAAEASNARRVIGLVEPVVGDKSVPPLAQLYWWSRVGLFYVSDGRYAEAEAALRKADEIAANFESHTATILRDLFWVFLRLAQLDVEQANRHLDTMLQALSPARDSDLMLSTFAQSLLAAHTDAPESASAAERRHLEANARVGLFFGETTGTVLLAAQLAQFEPAEEVERLLAGAIALICNTFMSHLEAQLLLVHAYSELRDGQRARARGLIESAVSMDRDTDLFALRLVPDVLPSVFNFALREGIGVAKIKAWIAHYQIAPAGEAPEGWPWPVRLYLLGGLRVICRDQPLQFKRKAPQKPLELLVLLSAAGAGGLTTRLIADRLWPDLEADAAAVNVDTNVYRLRKLLGIDDAVVSTQGHVALNTMRCWVDAWSFERLASQCVHASGEAMVEMAREALDLYKGPLLNQEGDQSWALAFREQLARRMIQLTELAGGFLEESGDINSAIELYQRSLALENLAEPIYRRLIACLKNSGETAEALKVFRRCRELLSVVLGVQPSKETQALVETLRQ